MSRNLAVRREFDSLMNSTFDDLWNNVFRLWDFGDRRLTTPSKASYPRVNVQDQTDKILIDAAVPGLTKDDVVVEYHKDDGLLTISGKSQNQSEKSENGYVVRELHKSAFSRSFRLDENVHDVEKISAGVDNGLLSVIIPKRETIEQKSEIQKIEVK